MESSTLEEQEDMGTSAMPFLIILHLDPVYFFIGLGYLAKPGAGCVPSALLPLQWAGLVLGTTSYSQHS